MLLLPDLKNYRQDWMHAIAMPNLGGKYIGHVTLDGQYLLFRDPYSYDLFVLPGLGSEHPRFDKLVFYANCLAFDHDLPVLMIPRFGGPLSEPLTGGGLKYRRDSYYDTHCKMLETLGRIRWGPLAYVCFRWSDYKKGVHLAYSEKYGKSAKELSLYSQALRQIDPLSEFLHYYRIIESVDGPNGGDGKAWIGSNLSRVKNFDFGFLELEEEGATRIQRKRRVNLFSRYRQRTQDRLKQLANSMKPKRIKDYFYHINRCGIAHGKKSAGDLRLFDFAQTVAEVSRDVHVLRLLSRIAIQDKIGSGSPVVGASPS
ncbi:MAG: methylamine utilization protein MauJ [Thermodesulfobacteriota bacterium]